MWALAKNRRYEILGDSGNIGGKWHTAKESCLQITQNAKPLWCMTSGLHFFHIYPTGLQGTGVYIPPLSEYVKILDGAVGGRQDVRPRAGTRSRSLLLPALHRPRHRWALSRSKKNGFYIMQGWSSGSGCQKWCMLQLLYSAPTQFIYLSGHTWAERVNWEVVFPVEKTMYF